MNVGSLLFPSSVPVTSPFASLIVSCDGDPGYGEFIDRKSRPSSKIPANSAQQI